MRWTDKLVCYLTARPGPPAITHNVIQHQLKTRKNIKVIWGSEIVVQFLWINCKIHRRLAEMRDVRKKTLFAWESWKRRGWKDNWDILLWSGIFFSLKGQQVTHFWHSFSIWERCLSYWVCRVTLHSVILWTILSPVFPPLPTSLAWRKYPDKIQFILYQARIGLWLWSKLIHVIYWNIS